MNSTECNILCTLHQSIFNLLDCVKIYILHQNDPKLNGPLGLITALPWIITRVLILSRKSHHLELLSEILDFIEMILFRCLNSYVFQIYENKLQILISIIKQTINETNGNEILMNLPMSRNGREFLIKKIMLIISAELQQIDRK